VFLAYVSEMGTGFVERSLYLPREWTNDPSRRAEAGVAEQVTFANNIELAKRMLHRAFAAGIPARWAAADSFYGRSHQFRKWLEERARPHVVMVPKTNALRIGGRRKKIEQLAERLPERAWSEVLPAQDADDRRSWEWACLELSTHPAKEMRRWLLLRRDSEEPDDLGFYQAFGPEGTSVEELIEVCQDRWAIEDCFAEAKGEVGLDHYEV
jgi:SRSO17 transposase